MAAFIEKIINKFHLTSTKAKIITNVFWAVTGKVVTMLSTLVVGIFVARYLGPEQYGLMNYVVSIVTLFTVFATFGTTEIIIRELAKKELPKEIILGSAFAIRIGLAVVCFFAIGIYLFFAKETTETAAMILIYASSIFFACFDVIRFYFTSIVENEYVVKSEVFRALVGALVKVILLFFHAPLVAFVAALAFDFLLLATGYVFAYKEKVGSIRNWGVDKAFIKVLLSTSFPLLISSAAMIVYQRIDQVMIAKMLDNESVGYFSTAASFIGVVTFIPAIMVQTTSPLLVGFWKNDKERYKKESQRIMNLTTWVTMLICIILSLLSDPIIRYTYGSAYLAAVPVLRILVFKAVGVALITMGGQLIVIENIHKWAFVRNILSCVVCVICNYYFIPLWGVIGSAWATIITVVFTGCFANVFIPPYHKIMKIQLRALFTGWRELLYVKSLFMRINGPTSDSHK